MKERIYVCHTYYHVYVTLLKEFARPWGERGQASIVLSSVSTDFENLGERLEAAGVFAEVIPFDEKPFSYFEELNVLREDKGNIVKNMWSRMRFTKRYAQLEEPFVPVDFAGYKEVYVFCDLDPIGYYLNYRHIRYHAVEDGLDTQKQYEQARMDNKGFFWLKALFASFNLIFMPDGYSKYCIDMEVNDKQCIKHDSRHYVEVPRRALEERLTPQEKALIVRIFLPDAEGLYRTLEKRDASRENVLVLTEKLCGEETRKRMIADIADEYGGGCNVFIKPHPMDTVRYEEALPECIVLSGRFPLEVMKHMEGIHFHRAVAIFTQAVFSMDFVDEKIFLGKRFLNRYEVPEDFKQVEE